MTVPNNSNVYLPGVIQTPSALTITAITNTYPMVITIVVNPITESNTYIPGQLIRLNIPYSYGMFQANGLTGKILSVSGSDFLVDIDARYFDSFTVPAVNEEQPATLSPSGSRNVEYENNTVIISFKSKNDIGN